MGRLLLPFDLAALKLVALLDEATELLRRSDRAVLLLEDAMELLRRSLNTAACMEAAEKVDTVSSPSFFTATVAMLQPRLASTGIRPWTDGYFKIKNSSTPTGPKVTYSYSYGNKKGQQRDRRKA